MGGRIQGIWKAAFLQSSLMAIPNIVRRSLHDWLSDMQLVSAGTPANRDARHAIGKHADSLPQMLRASGNLPVLLGRPDRTMLKSKIEKELASRLGELSAAEAPTLALLHSRVSTLKAGPIVNDQKVLRRTSSSDSRSIFDKTNYSQRGTLIDVNALRLGMALSENLHHVGTRFHCVLHCARGELPQVFAHPPRRKYADDWLRDGVAI